MVKTLKEQQRFIIETKANAESVIATEKADNEQWDIRLKNDKVYPQGFRVKRKKKK